MSRAAEVLWLVMLWIFQVGPGGCEICPLTCASEATDCWRRASSVEKVGTVGSHGGASEVTCT